MTCRQCGLEKCENAEECYYDALDKECWDDVYRQEKAEREDNEPPSGSTDLGNRGGTTFCY